MKAMRVHHLDGLDTLQLEHVPIPLLAPGCLLVRIVAAGINPCDWQPSASSGSRPALPYTPGRDGAGTVVAMAGDVRGFALDDAVCFSASLGGEGSYAEYAVVPATQLARMPQGLSFLEAAALPTPLLAAWTALHDMAALQAGQQVLVHGASGAVGQLAVQLARQMGAHVIAVSRHAGTIRLPAAHRVLAYRGAVPDADLHDIDVVLDTIGGDVQQQAWSCLRPGGLLLSTVSVPVPEAGLAAGVRSAQLQLTPDARVLSALLQTGLKLPIARSLTLEQAALAHDLGRQGKAGGKMVLLMPPRDLDLLA